MNADELTARLRAMFVEELADQLGEANRYLLALERNPTNPDDLRSLFRVMHTLKGAARSANVPEVERVCHRLETMLASARDASRGLTRQELDALFGGVDRLATLGDEMGGATRPANETNAATEDEASVQAETTSVMRADPQRDSAIKIGQDRVDTLFAISNRLLILGGQVEAQPAVVEQMHEAATRGNGAWLRLRRELVARIGATTPTIDRDLNALDSALETLRKQSVKLLGESLRTSRDLTRLSGEISRGVRELRMRPFADAVADLPRVVRDVAASTGKQVRLEVEGEDVQADRAVLAQIHDALLHLVRNAVDHGIEMSAIRRARGKAEEGTIRIHAGLIGDRIVVTVQDDGAGLDVGAMRRRLAERGEAIPNEDRALARRLFLGGVSTRDLATDISGRGVGLDAVRAAAERVRGSVDVDWIAGGGTVFTIEAPLTLATVRVILARVGKTNVAIPSAFIDRLVRVAPDALRVVEGRLAIETNGAPAFVASIASILGPPLIDHPADGPVHLAIVHVGERRVALRVDELIEDVEVVVRPIRAHGRVAVPHVSGAALLSNGAVALVLNVTAATTTALGLEGERPAFTDRTRVTVRKRVLVVDDSITTRTLESSVLEAAGFDVFVAVDGADGWRVLQERGADLVVSDVEMPRMDGLQLCEAMRASSRFRDTPVILVTALETDAHRARGLEVGADAYLGKSSFEQQSLLNTVRELLGSP